MGSTEIHLLEDKHAFTFIGVSGNPPDSFFENRAKEVGDCVQLTKVFSLKCDYKANMGPLPNARDWTMVTPENSAKDFKMVKKIFSDEL